MRPLTLAKVVVRALRLARGEPILELLWCPPPFRGAATILVRTATGWRQVCGPGTPVPGSAPGPDCEAEEGPGPGLARDPE